MKFFSFTFTIPAFKKIYWSGKKIKYGSLVPRGQFRFIENIMIKIINPFHFVFIDWVYEKHEDGRLHIHGFCQVEDEDDDKIFLLRDSFYTYNNKIGIKMSSYLKISDIQETQVNLKFWLNYIQKHQNEIIYKNGYTQQQILVQNLDAGIVKITENKKYRRPKDYFLKYRFGEHADEYETDNSLSVEI